MAIEKKYVEELIAEAAVDVCWNEEIWDNFLKVCGNTYKYSFANQLAIYAQRPDATFLCDYRTWNRMGRYVKKGSKGIRIVEKSRYFDGEYIFDAKDTEPARKKGKDILAWSLSEKAKPALESYVYNNYDKSVRSLEEKLIDLISEISEQNFMEYSEKLILQTKEDITVEFIEKLDSRMKFLTCSAVAVVFHRSGLKVPESFNMEYDFDSIDKPVNVDDFIAMGDVLAATSAEVLNEIERVVKKELAFAVNREYNKEKEQNEWRKDYGTDIQTGGRLSDSESGTATAAGGRSGQIRDDERQLPLRKQTFSILDDEHQGNIESTFDGNRSAGGRDDGKASEEAPAGDPGTGQGEGTGTVYGTSSADTPRSGEHSSDGDSIRITELSEDVIRQILNHDNFKPTKREELAGFFISVEDHEKRTAFVKNSFNKEVYSEFKVESDGESVYAGYLADDRKLKLWQGNFSGEYMVLSWEKVTEYIDKYIREERYLMPGESPRHLVTEISEENTSGVPSEKQQILSIINPELEELAKAYIEFSQLTDPYRFDENYPDNSTEEEITEEIVSYLAAADRKTIDEIIVKIKEIVQKDSSLIEKAERIIAGLNELLPSYQFYNGDNVFLDKTEYIILSMDDDQVTLYDTNLPLINRVMSKDEFITAASTEENKHLMRVSGYTPENTLEEIFPAQENMKSQPFSSETEGITEDVLRFCGKKHLQDNLINAVRKGKNDKELEEVLKEYTFAAEGFIYSGKNYVAWKKEDGLVIALEKTIRYAGSSSFHSWNELAKIVRTMMEEARYLPSEKISGAEEYEYQNAAQALHFMIGDLASDSIKKVLQEFAGMRDPQTGKWFGYDKSVENLIKTLKDAAAREYLKETLLTLAEEYTENKSLMRFPYYSPDKVLKLVSEFDIPKKEFEGSINLIPLSKYICELEIENRLAGGAARSDSIKRIFEHFDNNPDKKSRESFIKNHFGLSGSSGPDMLGYMTNGDGIRFSKKFCAEIKYKWPQITTIYERLYQEWKLAELEKEIKLENKLSYSDAFFIHPDGSGVQWIYYNPDSNSGGQYVTNYISTSDIAEAARIHTEPETFFDYLGSIARQEIADVGTEWFDDTERRFKDNPTFTECNNDTMCKLIACSNEFISKEKQLSEAKKLIDEYCRGEFGYNADFKNLAAVGIANTTALDEEIELQAYVNLVDFRIERYLQGVLIEARQYNTLEELVHGELEDLDFDDLTLVSEEQTAYFREQTEPILEPEPVPDKDSLTNLQKKAIEIAQVYKDLSLQDKTNIIAQAFGASTGTITTSPCSGKWRGSSDVSIRFDNGSSLFIGNSLTPQSKIAKVQEEFVDSALIKYNSQIIEASKETAIAALLQREAVDNEIALQKGLKPYKILNVEFNNGADEKTKYHIGWYYVTLAVDGKIYSHIETRLNYAIADGKVDIMSNKNYYTAGALKEDDVDYIFNNVGFSSSSGLYSLHMSEAALERAEKTLAEREKREAEKLQVPMLDTTDIAMQIDYEAYVEFKQLHENQIVGIYVGEYIVFLGADADYAGQYENAVKVFADEEEISVISREHEEGYINFNHNEKNLCFAEFADGEYMLSREIFITEKAQSEQKEAEEEKYPAVNHAITKDNLGHGSAPEKVFRNLAAIKLLKQLEKENRNATPDEQNILAEYIGWGGLPDVFDPSKPLFSSELNEILTAEEYTAARESVLNAHYTSPIIIRQMYRIIDNLGFSKGNILEPSCGVGNFFGMLPEKFSQSRLYGVELDSVSARIAGKLYPNANILQQGYEKTEYPDNSFDVAIGNVPFGNYSIADKRYDRHGFKIHDYFFAKTIDQVRANGVIAFITSKGTMDKKSSAVRRYIAERCVLLGAIRLPDTAFKKNAGTEVTSDILILQKRERLAINPQDEWLSLDTDANGLTYNKYFVEHPEMIIGEMKEVSGPFGMELTCSLSDPDSLEELLSDAVMNIQGNIPELNIKTLENELEETVIPADLSVPNFSYTVVENKIFYRENSQMREVHLSTAAAGRVRMMIELRDITKELIRLQLTSSDEETIKEFSQKLNAKYDAFKTKYGLINSKANEQVFRDDSSYPLICSLEELDDEGNFKRKADIFTKRTIRKAEAISHVEECSEALALSLSEKGMVDAEYMAQLTGKEKVAVLKELCELNLIFREDIEREYYVTADEYLSGNVRAKLAKAQAQASMDESFNRNVQALLRVQPKPLDASEIEVRLGATWIPKDYYLKFMVETFQTPAYKYRWGDIDIDYSEATGAWTVIGKSKDAGNIIANSTYGTSRASGYRIMEDSLNLRAVQITEVIVGSDGRERRVVNQKETMLAQQKQDALKEAFKNWIFSDPNRRSTLCELYNNLFNSHVAREYDGEHLKFPGMNASITLKPHQKRAVARQIYGGNTLLAHCVGAGKTYEMATAIMEKRRLGLCNKAMLVVPNHLTGQWASEFMRLYPTANILAVTKKDFTPLNRKKFCSRIATGDYDAVIIGHSQFEMIPISKERQMAFINEQLSDIETELIMAKEESGQSFTVKQLVKLEKELKNKLEKLSNTGVKDNTITFEELGVDFLCVDEAHNFKNLALTTKMRNVAGISTTGANKSYDMFAKCRYLDEITGSKGITFATGTPVSNSMTELYTMQKYLQYDRLQQQKMLSFDAWASTYGETAQVYELAPEGTGYRQKTRFSKFFNLPELMTVFKDVADVQTSDMLNLPVPKAEYETVVLKPSSIQKLMLAKLAERADIVRKGEVESYEDNMLKITTDGRKLALDERLAKDMLTESEYEGLQFTMTEVQKSKTQACVEKCIKHYHETEEQNGAQLIFSDLATPNKDGNFSVYNDIKEKLMAEGIPEEEIAFIHDYNTESKKEELFSKVRSGKVRFLLGSTSKMGAGMNVQNKLIALHHLDVPWKPSDIEQREGRIIRQGNENSNVFIYRYVTENTFDAYSWQIIENKQKFISQVMTSKSPVRSCDDIDEAALSFAEVKALCTGNPLIKEKMELDNEVSRLKVLQSSHMAEHYRLEDELYKRLPERMLNLNKLIASAEEDIHRCKVNPIPDNDNFSMKVSGITYTEKKDAGYALINEIAHANNRILPENVEIGEYCGFKLYMSQNIFAGTASVNLIIMGAGEYQCEAGNDPYGMITRINNILEKLPERLSDHKNKISDIELQMENAKRELEKPFARADELAIKEKRLAELEKILSLERPEETEKEKTADYDMISGCMNSVISYESAIDAEHKELER